MSEKLIAAVSRLRRVQNQLGTNGMETRLELRGDDLRMVLDALTNQGKPQITEDMVERAMEHRGFVASADCTCGHKASTTRAHLRHVLEAALGGEA